MKDKLTKGFTLIELMVVIAILALLSTIVLSALNDAREKAEWSKFDSEILEIRSAIELYKNGNNGEWPPSMVNGLPVYVYMSSVISDLNGADLYPNVSITNPTEYDQLVFYRADGEQWTGYHLNCNNDTITTMDTNVTFVLLINTSGHPFSYDLSEKSNLFKDYWSDSSGTPRQAAGYYCIEFK